MFIDDDLRARIVQRVARRLDFGAEYDSYPRDGQSRCVRQRQCGFDCVDGVPNERATRKLGQNFGAAETPRTSRRKHESMYGRQTHWMAMRRSTRRQ